MPLVTTMALACPPILQAVQERFILDVLENYVPVDSYYKLIKKIEDDPEFDTKRIKRSCTACFML